MKHVILFLLLSVLTASTAEVQLKEAAQLATLAPAVWVVTHDNVENYQKLHFTLSTISYLGTYMVTESAWQALVITIVLGAAKELVYDGLMNRGDPLWDDMMWNVLGTTQGAVFTLSLKL